MGTLYNLLVPLPYHCLNKLSHPILITPLPNPLTPEIMPIHHNHRLFQQLLLRYILLAHFLLVMHAGVPFLFCCFPLFLSTFLSCLNLDFSAFLFSFYLLLYYLLFHLFFSFLILFISVFIFPFSIIFFFSTNNFIFSFSSFSLLFSSVFFSLSII